MSSYQKYSRALPQEFVLQYLSNSFLLKYIYKYSGNIIDSSFTLKTTYNDETINVSSVSFIVMVILSPFREVTVTNANSLGLKTL